MSNKIYSIVLLIVLSLNTYGQQNSKLSEKILNDRSIPKVDQMARELMQKGFYAGSGYQMVWARDLNTFIELSCEEYDNRVIRENLIMFFHFQGETGEILDGYVPRAAFNWEDLNTYDSKTAPDHIGFKNTVETDQETSLIQAIAKYIRKTGDSSILDEIVDGKTIYDRLKFSIEYLLSERYSEEYGLIIGATTFDWGDIQVEGGAVVDVDKLTHWSIDVYDNAMLAIALGDMREMAPTKEDSKRWSQLQSDIKKRVKKHLWDSKLSKFTPHIYIKDSPFDSDFNENSIHYHGGTAIAIEAGILNKREISKITNQMKENVKLARANSIGLTIYPAYPQEVLGKDITAPYDYQNGGDWTWFGARMIQQLVKNGFIEEAYELSKPMVERVVKNGGFYEWYTMDGTPKGSAEFKGSAGALATALSMLTKWAQEQ